MRPAWRWTKRIVLGVLAVVVIALGVTLFALHTSWGRERVKNQVVAQLARSFPGGASIDRLDGSVFGELVANRIELKGTDHKALVTIEKLHIKLALWPLLHKTARIEELVAENVVVHARKQPPAPPAPPTEPSAWSVELPRLQIHSAQLEIETDAGTEHIADLDATAALYMPPRAALSVWVQATAKWRGKELSLVAEVRSDQAIEVPYASVTLGDGRLVAAGVRITDGPTIAGSLAVRAPAGLVHALAPKVELLGDVALLANSQATGEGKLMGSVGGSEIFALAKTDLAKHHADAIVAATVPDAGAVSRGQVQGAGSVVATIAGDENHASGLISILGDAEGQSGSALAVFDATRERASLIVTAAGAPEMKSLRYRSSRFSGALSAELAKTGERWDLVKSELFAEAHDIAPTLGHTEARFVASGPVWPTPSVAITGTVKGNGLVREDVGVASARARIEARVERDRSTGTAQLEIAGAHKGSVMIPTAMLAAHGAMDNVGVVRIDLDRHRVRTADDAIWTGTGGHVTITEDRIVLDGLRTGTGTSRITASATMARDSDAWTATVTARDVAIAMFDPKLGGQLAAELDVSHRGGRWSGTAKVDATQVTTPKQPPIDGSLTVRIADRQLTAHATAANPKLGAATFDLDVIGPADITNPIAWKHVQRSAIKNLRVALAKIDASQLGASGSVDGELAISASDATGTMTMHGYQTSAGALDSELVISRSPTGDIAARGTAHLAGLDPITVDAAITLPQHPFDPAAWQQLGRAALREATIEAPHLAFDPDLAKRFGFTTTARGTAALKITIGPGAHTGELVFDVHELTGIRLGKPVEIHLAGGMDDTGIHANASARADTFVVDLAAKTPLTIDSALAGRARSTQIDVTLSVPKVAARDVAMLLHREDVLGGVLGGTITLAGTIDHPTGRAQLAIENLVVAAGIARKPPTLQKLELDARWYGDHAELELTGFEEGGRVIKISGRGRPDSLATTVATIEAANFDLAPLTAFAPGQFSGARGILGGVVKIKGFDPTTGEARGILHISEGRMPLSDQLGTLRNATIDITINKQEIVAVLDGKLGAGTVKGKAIARLFNGTPTAAELDLKLRRISPIGAIQPVISADVSGWFAKTQRKWAGKLTVANADLYVPPEVGNELLGLGAPSDLIFVDAKTLAPKPARHAPRNPWLVTDVDVRRTKINVEDKDFSFEGYASGQLKLAYGDGLGLEGTIVAERGAVDVVGRRYRLDHGIIDFDGTLDPHLDIELVHDFHQQLTLTVDVIGRSSSPDVRLSGDPSTYSESQLLAVLMGGDPGERGEGAVVGGGAAIFSSRLAKKLTRRLPIKFDTINYEAATASSSRAIKIGKRLTDRLYLNYRQRFDARPDENPSEGVFEYDLSQSWLLEGTAGTVSQGADLMWRWRH